MRKFHIIFLLLLLTVSLFAQTPQKMSYQAVIRNSSNELVKSSPVGMQISILQGSLTGTPVYVETQTPTTNVNGLVSIEIGGGTIISGTFAGIDWSTGMYFIKTEIDPTGSTSYTITGISQLLSVPYALFAKTVAIYPETDPIFVASPVHGIASTNISNWNTAYSWGNHASAGYLTSFTETDPVFVASAAKGITSTNIANWTTAYNWGNHASAGYLTSFTETDPIFGAWNKSTGISITTSQVSDFQTSVTNNAAMLLNTSKNSYPTADANKLAAITGTNTGDETTSTIKTKLGITTLSGSNTGDQTLAGLGGVASNTAITGATKTKITYDTKGLVTSGADATTADIAASLDKNYVTNEQLTLISNTSGTNTGDNAINTLYSGLVTNATHSGDITGSGVLTLATVNSNVGTFNNITINAKGLATAGSNVSYLTSETDPTVKAITGIVKSDGTTISAATAGTDYLTPTGSAASLTGFPTLNQNTTGSAASFTSSLTGDVTGTQDATVVGNSAVLSKVLTGYVSGAGTVIATDNILQAIQKLNGNITHSIGDSYGVGIVFYVYDNGRHGLIAATADQSAGIRWYAGTNTNTMAMADGVGAGKANTAIIIANQGYGDGTTYAARICNEYSVTVDGVTYGDWYLPSKFELNLLYLQKGIVVNFANAYYWSSTEYNTNSVWMETMSNGYTYPNSKFLTPYVRAIRAF